MREIYEKITELKRSHPLVDVRALTPPMRVDDDDDEDEDGGLSDDVLPSATDVEKRSASSQSSSSSDYRWSNSEVGRLVAQRVQSLLSDGR